MQIRTPVLDVTADRVQPSRRSTERRDNGARNSLIERVVAEFREMPGLQLTLGQAQRLFGLRPDVCSRLIQRLVRDGMIRVDVEGRYVTL